MSETVNVSVAVEDDVAAKKKTESVTVRRDMVHRLIKDIKEVHADADLAAQGIHYEHNMDNFMEGHAMLVGPADTPYANGLFFFHFKYPEDYPYAPPVLKFLSRSVNNRVRINPNLYIEGKVCLSVLNTWEGEPWSACQSIRSVLLTLVTVLNDKPLMNEPGIQDTSPDHAPYNEIIRYTSLHDCFLLPMSRCCLKGEGEDKSEGEGQTAPFAHEELFLAAMQRHFASKFDVVERALRSMDFFVRKKADADDDADDKGARHYMKKTRAYCLRVHFDRTATDGLLTKLKAVSN